MQGTVCLAYFSFLAKIKLRFRGIAAKKLLDKIRLTIIMRLSNFIGNRSHKIRIEVTVNEKNK